MIGATAYGAGALRQQEKHPEKNSDSPHCALDSFDILAHIPLAMIRLATAPRAFITTLLSIAIFVTRNTHYL